MPTPIFTWTPSWGTAERSEPRTRNAELAQAAALGSDGTSADLKSWNVALENRLHNEALAIDLFLASRGGVEVFEWDNPRSLIKLYICEQWDCVVVADRGRGDAATDRIWTVTATFREVALVGAGGTVRPPRPVEVLPGLTVSGTFDPDGANRICVTAMSCAWYNVFFAGPPTPGVTVPPILGIDTTPGPALAPDNCYTIQGPFNIAIRGLGGGEYPSTVGVLIYTQAGFQLTSLALATVSGSPVIGFQGYDAPATISFTITPANPTPLSVLQASLLVYADLPTGQDLSLTPGQRTYFWPGIRSINVDPP